MSSGYHTELCKIFTLGLPRCLARDDVIGGYFIPAGSLMIFNTWYVWFSFKVSNTRGSSMKQKKKKRSVLHDETQYTKPYEFIPERHLDANGLCTDPTLEGFGYGKRYVSTHPQALVVAENKPKFSIQK